MAKRIDLCSADEVAPGNPLKVEADGLFLAVFNVDGEFYVTDDTCTHGPGSLSEGDIEDEVVESLEARRERWQISYHVIDDNAVDTFAPIVARLAGK